MERDPSPILGMKNTAVRTTIPSTAMKPIVILRAVDFVSDSDWVVLEARADSLEPVLITLLGVVIAAL